MPDARPELAGTVFAYGFSYPKRKVVRSFLPRARVRFVTEGRRVAPGSTLLLWGAAEPPADLPGDVRILRAEDGFLRSVGLGAELVRPLSWVFDSRGIYFDSTRPSDLEHLLQTAAFDPSMLARAEALRHRLAASGLTKYNVGGKAWRRPAGADRVVLVPGQVETDASIRRGAPGIRTNIGLLRAVREANPDAWVVYKIHPDVLAGLRARGQGEDDAGQWCDEVVTDVAMGEMLAQVDEVHTLTSLAGFEGLLRGCKVTCYGQPFYAGWGLTDDVVPVARRQRRLTLDELVAGALILYPVYVGRVSGRLVTAEEALDELLAWRAAAGTGPLPLWRKAWRAVMRFNAWYEGRR